MRGKYKIEGVHHSISSFVDESNMRKEESK